MAQLVTGKFVALAMRLEGTLLAPSEAGSMSRLVVTMAAKSVAAMLEAKSVAVLVAEMLEAELVIWLLVRLLRAGAEILSARGSLVGRSMPELVSRLILILGETVDHSKLEQALATT